MSGAVHLDRIDRQIVNLLRAGGRRTIRDIAQKINLSPAPVRRRIRSLEKSGIITGYRA